VAGIEAPASLLQQLCKPTFAASVLPACMLASMATAIFLSTASLSYISLLPTQRFFFLIIDRCCRLFCMSAMSAAVPVAA
jgi:hypothetical protein